MDAHPGHEAAEHDADILLSIDKWLARDVKPHVRALEHADEYPQEMVEQMKALGLFGATIPADYGGLGLSAMTYAKIVERIAEVWMSLTGIFNSHLIMAACVTRQGTETQKRDWLPRFASGEVRGGLALTEPDAGTDLQAIRTRAARDGNGYVINGTKTWISNGIHGSCYALLAKTDPAAEPRHKGMSMFLAEKGPGFTVSKKLEKLGYKGLDFAELVFDDYRVSGDRLIGEVEGQGLQAALGGLELGRINVAARGCGIASAALNDSVRYAQVRKTFGKPICEHQAIQLKLGEMATRVQAARLLTYDAARAYDKGERCDMEAGMAKFFSSEAAVENSLEAMRIHGGYGYSKEFDIERYYRDAPLMCIGEGTNEIQRMIIAKQLIAKESGVTAAASTLPLAGVRILAVEQYGAGPFASLYLSDLGAEVIKIEPPPGAGGLGGDASRHSGPYFLGENDSHFFQTFNLGKRSIALDLKEPDGRGVFERLVSTADAVLNNLRGDQPDKLGLTHAHLARIKPAVVCAHLSGYGRTGTRADRPAYDYLMQAEAGYFVLTGEPDSAPTRMGLSIVDYVSGITTAFALTAALLSALKTGRGRDVDVTLYDVAIHQLTYPAVWFLNEGAPTGRRPRSGHPAVVPCELFPTADGAIYVMCVLPKFWVALCRALELDALIADRRFSGPRERFANRDALAEHLDRAFRERSTQDWMSRLAGRVPAAPVLTLDQALTNPYLEESGGIVEFDHPKRPGFRVLANPIRVDGERMSARRAPAFGEDTDALLAEIGYSPDSIATLRARGAVA